jgi:hypothetical protein
LGTEGVRFDLFEARGSETVAYASQQLATGAEIIALGFCLHLLPLNLNNACINTPFLNHASNTLSIGKARTVSAGSIGQNRGNIPNGQTATASSMLLLQHNLHRGGK